MVRLLFVPWLFVLQGLYAQNKELNQQATLLKNLKIKQLAIYETIMLGDSIVQPKYLSQLIIFNPDGTLQEEQDYDTEGNLEGFVSKYEYQNGKLIKQIMDWIQRPEHDIIEYEYQNGLLIKQKEYNAGVLLGWHEYQYDNKGRIRHCAFVNANGILDTTLRYEYQNGLLIKMTRTNEKGETIFASFKEYSKQGWLLKETIQEGRKEEGNHIIQLYSYDKQGKLLKSMQQSLSEKLLFEVNYFYKPNGLLYKVTSYDHLTSLFVIEEYEYRP